MERLRQATIFLAEDNPDDVEITRRAFRRRQLGYELLIARDGEEALQVLKQAKPLPDLAMLDLNLPRVSGLQVLESLRADLHFCAMPIVVLSASDREEDVRRSYELGANTYIQKPVVFEKFLDVLEALARYWFEVARLPRSSKGEAR